MPVTRMKTKYIFFIISHCHSLLLGYLETPRVFVFLFVCFLVPLIVICELLSVWCVAERALKPKVGGPELESQLTRYELCVSGKRSQSFGIQFFLDL